MLPAWTKAKNFSRQAHQDVVDELNYQGNLVGIGPVEVSDSCGGKTVSVDILPSLYIEVLATIIAPEDSDHTYTDPRYRCRVLKIISGAFPEDPVGMDYEDDQSLDPEGGTEPTGSTDPDWGYTVTATNVYEITDYTTGAGTHRLKEDESITVHLFGVYDRIPGDAKVDKVRWFFDRQVSIGLIPVDLTWVAGTDGDATTAASWTYNATDVEGNSITGGPFSPAWARAPGSKTKATKGNGYYDTGGNFVLSQVDEVDNTTVCPEAGA